MASITTRSGKGSALTHGELDANFTGINNEVATKAGTSLSNVSGAVNLTLSGSLTAAVKNFLIDHPSIPGKRLQHGSLEGPENGVYVRGRTQSCSIELPDYWVDLVDPDTITVNLTPLGVAQLLYVIAIDDNTVYVGGDVGEYFYTVYGERKDVDKLIVEIDA